MKINVIKKEIHRLNGIMSLAKLIERPQERIQYSGKTNRLLNVTDTDNILGDAVQKFAIFFVNDVGIRFQTVLSKNRFIRNDVVLASVRKADIPVYQKLAQIKIDPNTVIEGKLYISPELVRFNDFELNMSSFQKATKSRYAPYDVAGAFQNSYGWSWNIVMVPAIKEWLEKNNIEL